MFNEVGWLDPFGHLIRLVEARTFSPASAPREQVSLCGYFAEIALPARSLADAKTYWEGMGFVGMDEPGATIPHVSCTSDTVDVGLYEARYLRRPTLLFEADDVGAQVSRLGSLGIEPAGGTPDSLQRVPLAAYLAPEGTQIFLMAST